MGFSDEAYTPGQECNFLSDCYDGKLMAASELNKRQLTCFIENLRPGGSSNYKAGLKKAFSLFQNEEKSKNEVQCKIRNIQVYFT